MRFLRRRIPNPNPYPRPNPSPIVVDPDTFQLTGIVNPHTEEASSSSLPHQDALTDEINDNNIVHQTETTPAATDLLAVAERNVAAEGPPMEDCCPICFSDFVVPCRAPCGHWYCGGCILRYWNHGTVTQPCKCPMCSRYITKLMPEPSLYQQEDVEVSAVLKNVQQYNSLFVGGIFGLFLKMRQFPLFMKKVLQAIFEPGRLLENLSRLRFIAILLSALYSLFPFEFLPTVRAYRHLDQAAFILAFILYLIGLYIQRRRRQNVQQLAAA